MAISLFLSGAAQYRVFLNVLADQLSLCLCLALSGTTQSNYEAEREHPSNSVWPYLLPVTQHSRNGCCRNSFTSP